MAASALLTGTGLRRGEEIQIFWGNSNDSCLACFLIVVRRRAGKKHWEERRPSQQRLKRNAPEHIQTRPKEK